MKFYNPFKWHIVQNQGGYFYIRKYDFRWIFMSDDGSVWRALENVNSRCRFNSIGKAKEILAKFSNNFKLVD